MNNYSISLFLSYLKEKKENYSINELMRILGYTVKQMDEFISYLLSKKYIKYVNSLLCVTPKGFTFLISKNQDEFSIQEFKPSMSNIKPETALSIYYPYVPFGFDKKYKG